PRGTAKGPEAITPSDTEYRMEERERTVTKTREVQGPPDIDRNIQNAIKKLPDWMQKQAGPYLQQLTPQEKQAIASGRLSMNQLIEQKAGMMSGIAKSMAEQNYPGGIAQLDKDLRAPSRRTETYTEKEKYQERVAIPKAPIGGIVKPVEAADMPG